MDRRKFLGWFSVGMFASSLPVVLAACQSKQTDKSTASTSSTTEEPVAQLDTSVRPDGFQALGTVEQLDKKGTIIDRNNTSEAVLIFRNPDTQEIAAVNPLCTHQGCTVKLEGTALACPCHQSKFAFDGKVLGGPAPKPLDNFPVKQEGNLILVKVTSS